VTDERTDGRRTGAGTSEGEGTRSAALALAPFTAADTERLAELDRSESVAMWYAVRRGEIVPIGRGEEVPQWSGAWLDEVVAFTRRHLEEGGTGVAAFDAGHGDRLAGVAVLGARPVGGDPEVLQLALLHVSRPYRRSRLAARLLALMRDEAVRRGARRLAISATPSEGALRFYLAQGARLADPPDPDLLALEPEDVHLVLDV
jgi:GNAT superfamily N-acetyltransferase